MNKPDEKMPIFFHPSLFVPPTSNKFITFKQISRPNISQNTKNFNINTKLGNLSNKNLKFNIK